MKEILAATVALSAFAAAAHAADSDTTPRLFKPSGPWAADYGDDYCRLARNFSDGTDTISLGMDRIQPGYGMRMIFISNTIKLFRGAKTVGYRFLPSGADREGLMLRSDTGDGKQFLMLPAVVMAPPPKAPESGAPQGPPPPYSREQEQEFASQVSGVALTKGVIDEIEIDTGGMKPVIAALQACTDDLLKYWKIDVDKQRSQTRPVLPDGDTSDWLPRGMIGFQDFGKLGGGANMVRLLVDATGKPTDCAIHFPSLQKSKNEGICKNLLEKAHFLPALDASGQPFASYFTTSPMFLAGPGFGGRRR